MPHPRNKGNWDKGRKHPGKRHLRRFLILCEDTKSSRDYLARFPHDPAQVLIDCVGTGMNTDSLMEQALKRKADAKAKGEPYEQIWAVFDRDSFPQQNFNRAFDLARAHGDVIACWSNECFELWYLLHFAFRTTPIDRAHIGEELSKHLGQHYDKADSSLYEKLKGRIPVAMLHAQKLAFESFDPADEHGNPSTCVHQLVALLQSLDPSEQ